MAEEMITKEWMERLGLEDGAALADRVLDDLQFANSRELIDHVAAQAVASINQLGGMYRERGVSDELVLAWRTACHREMQRVFGEARAAKDQSAAPPMAEDDAITPDSPPAGDTAATAELRMTS